MAAPGGATAPEVDAATSARRAGLTSRTAPPCGRQREASEVGGGRYCDRLVRLNRSRLHSGEECQSPPGHELPGATLPWALTRILTRPAEYQEHGPTARPRCRRQCAPRARHCLLKGCEQRFHPQRAAQRYCSEGCRQAGEGRRDGRRGRLTLDGHVPARSLSLFRLCPREIAGTLSPAMMRARSDGSLKKGFFSRPREDRRCVQPLHWRRSIVLPITDIGSDLSSPTGIWRTCRDYGWCSNPTHLRPPVFQPRDNF
jgi:hypothetical protein